VSGCCAHAPAAPGGDPGYRRVLWTALAVNGGMFLVELASGQFARSASLQADAVDFLGDAATYAITLYVLAMPLAVRAWAAMAKAASMGAFGLWAIGNGVWHLASGNLPEPAVMGPVAVLACAANVAVALLLYRHRGGDANRRSVWLCSRNDAIANVAVMGAAVAVAAGGSGWPDALVAFAIAGLALMGAVQVARQAAGELAGRPRAAGHAHHAHGHTGGD